MHPKFQKARAAAGWGGDGLWPFRLPQPPKFAKEKLTVKRARELAIGNQHFRNLLAFFGDQHYGELLEFVAKRHPDLMRRWLEEAIEHDPTLRGVIFKEINSGK